LDIENGLNTPGLDEARAEDGAQGSGMEAQHPVNAEREPGREPGSRPGIMRQFVVLLPLLAVALFILAQVAGITLRDRLEGRKQTADAEALSEVLVVAKSHVAAKRGASSEASDSAKAGGAVTTNAAGKGEAPGKDLNAVTVAKQGAADPGKIEQLTPASGLVQSTSPAAAPGATHVVKAGAFASQKYLMEAVGKVRELGLPVQVVPTTIDSEGFTLTVGAADNEANSAAISALTEAGYVFSAPHPGVTVYFRFEGDAEAALKLSREFTEDAAVKPYKGPMPLWRVLAGPMDAEAAKAAAMKMKSAGLEAEVVEQRL